MNEFFNVATESNFQLRSSFQKLKCQKTSNDQYVLSYIGPTVWNQAFDTFECSNDLNTFKHNLKKYFLKKLRNSNNSF